MFRLSASILPRLSLVSTYHLSYRGCDRCPVGSRRPPSRHTDHNHDRVGTCSSLPSSSPSTSSPEFDHTKPDVSALQVDVGVQSGEEYADGIDDAGTGCYADLLADALMEAGAGSVVIQNEHEVYGSLHDSDLVDAWSGGRLWPESRVTAYFPPDTDVTAAMRTVSSRVSQSASSLPFTTTPVFQHEWVDAIKAQHQPIEPAPGVWVVPSWSEPRVVEQPEVLPVEDRSINIFLNPGVAFVTGDHPTTALCLRWIKHHPWRPTDVVVDYGCGSGVLSIAALKLGAHEATGTDIDPLAVRATLYNGTLNGVSVRLRAYTCGATRDDADPLHEMVGKADVVVANILQGPLRELRDRLLSYTKPGGWVVLSGVTVPQAEVVAEEYAKAGLVEVEVVQHNGWGLVAGKKKTNR